MVSVVANCGKSVVAPHISLVLNKSVIHNCYKISIRHNIVLLNVSPWRSLRLQLDPKVKVPTIKWHTQIE